MNVHTPAFLIVLPLMAAPLCLFIRHKSAVRIFASAVAIACACFAWQILLHVITPGESGTRVIRYAMGGWSMPMGIEYYIDTANAFVLLIVAGIGAVVMPFGIGCKGLAGPEGKQHLFYAALLLCMTGLLGIAITGDAFNVFVFLEITSLSTYALVSMGKGRRALTAAYNYLIMGTIGGTFILVGVGFIFAMTGSLNIMDIRDVLSRPGALASPTAAVAFGFLLVGTSIKLAVFPLYQWLPNAYSFAPSKVSAFLSATATKVSYYVLLRIIFTVFGAAFVFNVIGVQTLLLPLSLVAMFVGSLAAIYQTNIKRLLAYSSIAQVGYMTLGICLIVIDGNTVHNYDGLTGGIVHLFNHALMKCGLFLVVGAVVFRLGTTTVGDMKGLAYRMPWTFAAFVVGGLSLIGVPGTVGFVSKWYLVLGALAGDQYLVAALILISSLLAVFYVWKVVEVGYFQKPEGDIVKTEAPLSMLIPIWILMIGSVVFGIAAEFTTNTATYAAENLIRSGVGMMIGGGS